MKKAILFIAIIGSVSARGQSLKELLYSGKLKSDTGTLVKKTDDLSTKIDTTTRKKPVEANKTKLIPPTYDSLGVLVKTDSASIPQVVAVATTPAAISTETTKDNNKIWKDYMEELITTLRTEVMPSKKIKEGIYSVLVEYEIGVDGGVTTNSVSCEPESSFLQQQVRERLTLSAPQMTPLLGTNGKPRKAVKKYTFTINK